MIRDARGLVCALVGLIRVLPTAPSERPSASAITLPMPVNATAPTTAATSLALEMGEVCRQSVLTFSGLMVVCGSVWQTPTNDPGFETQRNRRADSPAPRAACPSSQTRLSCSCGSNRFVRPVARSDQWTLLRSGFRLSAIACLRSAPTRLANRLRTVRRLGHRRVGDVLGVAPPPRSPPPRSILPTRNWSSRCNARRLPQRSPADSRRAVTAACVMAAAALRRFRTAAQTASRNSDLVALFSVIPAWQLVRDHIGPPSIHEPARLAAMPSKIPRPGEGRRRSMSAVRLHRRRGRSAPGWHAQWFHRQLNESPDRQLIALLPHVQGAGKGNRTLIASLEGWSFTIKLCPRARKLPRSSGLAKFFSANA